MASVLTGHIIADFDLDPTGGAREEVLGSIPAVAARSPLCRRQSNVTGCSRSHGPPALSRVWQHIKNILGPIRDIA